MQFLRNTWYAAAWSEDIGRKPFDRKIIDQPIVLYRTQAGEVVALFGVCPHRFASLSLGKLVHDEIECAYHGLRFDRSGVCVHNPHGPVIPDRARVRKFTVVERDGIVWIWMGKAEEADESKITRFPMLNRPDHFTYTRGQTMQMPLSYELITDNLMDLSHVAFIHADSLGSDCLVPGQTATRREGNAIWSDRIGFNGSAPTAFWASRACKQDDRVDYWIDMRWSAPANFYLYGGVTPPGRPREEGKEISSVQILTPASANQTHYLIKHFRNYEREDADMTRLIEKSIIDAFANEDEPIIARVTENMAGRSFWDMQPVVLQCDSAAIRVRRARDKMLREELEESNVTQQVDIAS
jgi:phenylpropionate dioxygenase-like ring-hydroxylating dioxygenase large terminal subunit